MVLPLTRSATWKALGPSAQPSASVSKNSVRVPSGTRSPTLMVMYLSMYKQKTGGNRPANHHHSAKSDGCGDGRPAGRRRERNTHSLIRLHTAAEVPARPGLAIMEPCASC